MLKKYSVFALAVLTINLFLGAAVFGATTNEEKEAKFAAKVKSEITKLGTGKDARVEVKLKDGTKLKGYVSQINETSFVVMDEKTATPTEVPYQQTKQVKGHNHSERVAIILGVVIVVVVIVIIGLRGRSS